MYVCMCVGGVGGGGGVEERRETSTVASVLLHMNMCYNARVPPAISPTEIQNRLIDNNDMTLCYFGGIPSTASLHRHFQPIKIAIAEPPGCLPRDGRYTSIEFTAYVCIGEKGRGDLSGSPTPSCVKPWHSTLISPIDYLLAVSR